MSIGYTGVLTFLKINKAASQTDLHIKTGYYLGTGNTLSITGFGFSPQMIIIKADTNAGSAIWKTIDMPVRVYSYWGNATANNTEAQLTLDTDGLTVEVNPDVNLANTRYTYIAFSATADNVTGTLFSGLNTDGFNIGNNTNINRSGTMFNFFIFKNTPNKFQVGKYIYYLIIFLQISLIIYNKKNKKLYQY